MKISDILKIALVLLPLAGCSEEERFTISSDDSVPPKNPIFVDSEPLLGGARVHYLAPDDEDLLYIEASYQNGSGKTLYATSSYFATSVEIYGFLDAGDHTVTLKSVDRSGNKSSGVKAVVASNEAPMSTVAATVEVLPSFGSYLVRWQNPDFAPLYVSLRTEYTQNGKKHDFTTSFATAQSETQSIDNLLLREGETVTVTVTLQDKYGNTLKLPATQIVLPVDSPLDKSIWSLPEPGTIIGGVVQANGNVERGEMAYLYDGITEADGQINYYQTDAANPWNVIVDLGKKCRISRVLTHQRYSGNLSVSGNNIQGAYYRDENVLAYNIYIWDS